MFCFEGFIRFKLPAVCTLTSFMFDPLKPLAGVATVLSVTAVSDKALITNKLFIIGLSRQHFST